MLDDKLLHEAERLIEIKSGIPIGHMKITLQEKECGFGVVMHWTDMDEIPDMIDMKDTVELESIDNPDADALSEIILDEICRHDGTTLGKLFCKTRIAKKS